MTPVTGTTLPPSPKYEFSTPAFGKQLKCRGWHRAPNAEKFFAYANFTNETWHSASGLLHVQPCRVCTRGLHSWCLTPTLQNPPQNQGVQPPHTLILNQYLIQSPCLAPPPRLHNTYRYFLHWHCIHVVIIKNPVYLRVRTRWDVFPCPLPPPYYRVYSVLGSPKYDVVRRGSGASVRNLCCGTSREGVPRRVERVGEWVGLKANGASKVPGFARCMARTGLTMRHRYDTTVKRGSVFA